LAFLRQQVAALLPIVEAADERHLAGIGRPYSEVGARAVRAVDDVGAELVIEPELPSLNK
jgi:hypothetical protein